MPNASARRVVIFYSWQSDRAEDCCKRFIRIAAEEASTSVGTRLGVEVVIESDTEGVPGTPPISDTILEKIAESDLFLADMTFVGETPGSKLLPNPNVMGEYGYALRAKTERRILLAMNTAFGPPDALPFDLRHMRHPAQYSLAESASQAERRSARKRFAATLERNIEAAVLELLSAPAIIDSNRWVEAETALQLLHAQPFILPVPVIVSGPKLLVEVVPLASLPAPAIAPALVKEVRPHFAPTIDAQVKQGADETHWWASGPWQRVTGRVNPETIWLFRLTSAGLFQIQRTIGRRIDDDPEILVSGREVEAHLVSAVDRVSEIAQRIGLAGPALVAASLEQMEDVVILRHPGASSRLKRPTASMGTVRIDALTAPTASKLKQLMDKLWLIGGWEDGSPSFNSGHWNGYDKALF